MPLAADIEILSIVWLVRLREEAMHSGCRTKEFRKVLKNRDGGTISSISQVQATARILAIIGWMAESRRSLLS
jgi:hypothetical protein